MCCYPSLESLALEILLDFLTVDSSSAINRVRPTALTGKCGMVKDLILSNQKDANVNCNVIFLHTSFFIMLRKKGIWKILSQLKIANVNRNVNILQNINK